MKAFASIPGGMGEINFGASAVALVLAAESFLLRSVLLFKDSNCAGESFVGIVGASCFGFALENCPSVIVTDLSPETLSSRVERFIFSDSSIGASATSPSKVTHDVMLFSPL